jgi:hypothetical protein
MISKLMRILSSELNRFLKKKLQLSEDLVIAANLIECDGTVATGLQNKIVLTIINIERETNLSNAALRVTAPSGNYLRGAPAIHINLQILVSAVALNVNYLESLNLLSETMLFFHQRPLMTQETTPEMAGIAEELAFEMLNLSLDELGTLWGRLGGKYLPSVVYRVRMK